MKSSAFLFMSIFLVTSASATSMNPEFIATGKVCRGPWDALVRLEEAEEEVMHEAFILCKDINREFSVFRKSFFEYRELYEGPKRCVEATAEFECYVKDSSRR